MGGRVWVGVVLLLALAAQSAHAVDEAQERRIRSGLRLFRALLAADEEIAAKADSGGTLELAVVHDGDAPLAVDVAEELGRLSHGEAGTIRGRPVRVVACPRQDLLGRPSPPAGVYLVEVLASAALAPVVAYGVAHGIVVYSPFEGDVARGILGGMIIETRVRPHINMATLRASKVKIKDFFLAVARQYEP